MQGSQLKRWSSLAVIALGLFWSSRIGGLRFVPIYQALVIKAQKNAPPYVAFEELIRSPSSVNNEWSRFEKILPTSLKISDATAETFFSRKVELSGMVIQKPEAQVVNDTQDWMSELPRAQAKRLQEAQQRSDVLKEDWSVPSWTERAKDILEKSGVLAPSASASKVYVAAQGLSGKTETEVPRAGVEFNGGSSPNNLSHSLLKDKSGVSEKALGRASIVGHIEIAGGLGYTNEHYIEVRRSDEGVLKELGRVDLLKGLYYIDVEEPTGTVMARLVDKDGKVLGEKAVRLTSFANPQSKFLQGPPITINRIVSYSGLVSDAYNSGYNDKAPTSTKATFVKGANEVAATKDGKIGMENVMKGSSTVLRVAAPKHLQTTSIILAGTEFKAELFPVSMIRALYEIVGQQRTETLNEVPAIIWGRVQKDGSNTSGAEVLVESDPNLQPVYFNQLMLPDPNLKATSDNGLFAFVDVSPGYHSLLALNSSGILGYQNVVVEEGSVAQGNILGANRSEAVPLRVYDAFSGDPKDASITMQSIENDLQVENGVTTVSLPRVQRVGMMRVQAQGVDYVTARYLYNDSDEFIHAPLIQWSWINAIKSYLQIDDHPSAGYVVGFVPDENFEVYLAGDDNFPQRQIVYFDLQGRILQNNKGIAGGGFILFNVPEDTHEVVVIGERTQKIYSRVLPVDSKSLSVLTFR